MADQGKVARIARQIFEGHEQRRRFERLRGELAPALRGGEAGILRVGATPQVIENLLAGFLLRYRQCCPNVGGPSGRGWRRPPAEPPRAGRRAPRHNARG
jgi:hypothetical protein